MLRYLFNGPSNSSYISRALMDIAKVSQWCFSGKNQFRVSKNETAAHRGPPEALFFPARTYVRFVDFYFEFDFNLCDCRPISKLLYW